MPFCKTRHTAQLVGVKAYRQHGFMQTTGMLRWAPSPFGVLGMGGMATTAYVTNNNVLVISISACCSEEKSFSNGLKFSLVRSAVTCLHGVRFHHDSLLTL